MSQVEQEYDGGNSCINCGEELEEFDTDTCWCCEQETVYNIDTTMVSGIMCTKCNVVLEPHLMTEHLDKNHRVHCCKTGHKRQTCEVQEFCVGCEEYAEIKGYDVGGEKGVNLCVNCWS